MHCPRWSDIERAARVEKPAVHCSRHVRRGLRARHFLIVVLSSLYSNHCNAEHVQECLLGKYCFSSGQPTNTCSKTATIRPNMKARSMLSAKMFFFFVVVELYTSAYSSASTIFGMLGNEKTADTTAPPPFSLSRNLYRATILAIVTPSPPSP